jgi:hypothetical protein
MGRYVFYNQSFWDGNNATANASDDAAIAPDKTALLPGGTATMANYTSYSRGLNGVMVDIADLASLLTVEDFGYRVGNNNTPSGWAAGPPPTTVSVRWGAGVAGSDRVTLIWANNAVQKQWLELTVHAGGNTDLGSADVFYFGNAIGEGCHDPANALVNVTDLALARNNPHSPLNPAPLDDAYDFNRDGLVNVTEIALARANQTSPLSMLRLITVPLSGSGASLPASREEYQLLPASAKAGNPVWLYRGPEGLMHVRFKGASGLRYRVEVSSQPGIQTWHALAQPTQEPEPSGLFDFVDPTTANEPMRFYRVIAE